MDEIYKFVDFDKYCVKCKHANTPEEKNPCAECLEWPVNIHSAKPLRYEENEV